MINLLLNIRHMGYGDIFDKFLYNLDKDGLLCKILELNKSALNNVGTVDGCTLLMLTSLCGAKKAVRLLLDLKVDINKTDERGYTALMMALQSGHRDIFDMLLKAGADVSIVNRFQDSCFSIALKNKDYDITKLLIDNYDVIKLDDNCLSYIMIVISRYENALLEQILKRLWDIGGIDFISKNPEASLFYAIKKTNVDAIRLLLGYFKDNINYQSIHNRDTALIVSSQYPEDGGYDIFELLLSLNPDINIKNMCGETALIKACEKGANKIAKKLIELGADVNVETFDGVTSLKAAVKDSNYELVELLLDKSDRLSIDDAKWVALDSCEFKMIKLFIDKFISFGKDISEILNCFYSKSVIQDFLETYKNTDPLKFKSWRKLLLFQAISYDRMDCVETIISFNKDIINEKFDDVGDTPLIRAACYFNIDIVKFLLESGADPFVKDEDGFTALECVKELEKVDIISILEDYQHKY